ncbi:ribosomal protein L22, putative [Ixodes scapularis]|uniref:Large ribosomal subunit protein uL22m n=1 Tax=Ixodes scapularis TaxID=6945 RepID=B7P3T1_IXOSC|nr:ribosomal protein L22, putative [Ixodes scapularis]|eukprot:XP_002404610.1 ribosomal protein L22, putative [Ixodes scapularis]
MFAFCRQALRSVVASPSTPSLASQFLKSGISTTPAALCLFNRNMPVPRKWPLQNKKIYPPQEPEEERRPAWVCHYRNQIRYSPKKMLALTQFIRGMSIDEAIKQLSFVQKKGAKIMLEVLKEAQEMAVKHHNVEFKSNLWVAESFTGKGVCIKGLRRHARGRMGMIRYQYSHFFVRLVEGAPPKHYYGAPKTAEQKLEEYVQTLRDRRITHGI